MDTHTQQALSYINQHLAQGYSEAQLRAHFIGSGWQAPMLDNLFKLYYQQRQGLPVSETTYQPVAQQATSTSARSHTLHWIIAGTIGLCFVTAVGVTAIHLFGSKGGNSLAQPALQQNAQDTNAKNDINSIAATFETYISDHTGVLPQRAAASAAHTLIICGPDCSTGDTATTTLNFYPAAHVSFLPYQPGITVPDTTTVYIIPGSSCNGDSLGSQTATRGAAFLYAIGSSSKLAQRCLGV